MPTAHLTEFNGIPMKKNGAREVILEFLSTFGIGPGQKALRRDIESWCFENQKRYDVSVKSDTYQQQIRLMTINSGKWKDGRDEERLNDIFCPCSAGTKYAIVFDPMCCKIND